MSTWRLDRVNRHSERARTELSDLLEVLDSGPHVGTLSTVIDGKPWVVPMLYGREGSTLYLHGSVGAGALRFVSEGAAVALSVTHMDGWVYAHDGFNSSANYRSAVVHGVLRTLRGDEAARALTVMVESMTPGRSAEVPTHTRKQLAATMALALDIDEGQWTVKVRNAPPGAPDPADDVDPALWTGVLPIRTVYGDPIAAPHLDPDHPVSPSVLAYIAAESAAER
jgi:uncharacterized protein